MTVDIVVYLSGSVDMSGTQIQVVQTGKLQA